MTSYQTPTVPAEWADSRETHPAVAMAIHAISGPNRSPEDIWERPTEAECDHVAMAVESYINAGLFHAEPDGRYSWGEETIRLAVPATERWFLFCAFNASPVYGYGTEDEASRYQDHLNQGREVGHYEVREPLAEEVARLNRNPDEGLSLADELDAIEDQAEA